MKRRAPTFFLAALLLSPPSFAQTVNPVAPRVSLGAATVPLAASASAARLAPTLVTAAPSVAPLAPGLVSLAPSLIPAASVPVPAAAARSAIRSVESLAAHSASARAIYDGQALKAASLNDAEPPPLPVFESAQDTFILQARRLFAAARRAEAERLAAPAVALPEAAVPTDGDMQGRMERLPSTNPEREKFIIELFKLAGAKPADIILQDTGRGRNNIMVVKKGRTDRVIVVGGHHDKVRAGKGTIDNGTGSTMVANLYQALHDVETEATIVFIAFAREEEGLIGSAKYVDSLSPAQRKKIDVMINLDTLAIDGTYSWQNNSTRAVLDRLNQVSRASGHQLEELRLNGGDGDNSSFRDAGIPHTMVYGGKEDRVFEVIHSENDNMTAFSLAHYKNAYLLVLEALKSFDRAPLGPVAREDI